MPDVTRLTEGGRIVIPAKYRRALGINVGDEVVLQLEDGELRIFTLQRAIQRAQEIVRQYDPNGASAADELVRERHAEAEHE